jgi:hypothetical protein
MSATMAMLTKTGLLTQPNIPKEQSTAAPGVLVHVESLRMGTRWRSANFAVGQEYVRYKRVTAKAAAYFDVIIDSVCLLPATGIR